MTTLCATQPTLFPPVHLLSRALASDHLVLLTTAQFSRRTQSNGRSFLTWQNACRIVAPSGPMILVAPTGESRLPLDRTSTVRGWPQRFQRSIQMALGKAPHYHEIVGDVHRLLDQGDCYTLGGLNLVTWLWALGRLHGLAWPYCINRDAVAAAAGLSVHVDGQLAPVHRPGSAWMLDLCLAARADRYVAGATAAGEYLDTSSFAEAGVDVVVHRFDPEPWPQRAEGFEPDVCILDLVAAVGWDGARERLAQTTLGTTRSP